MKYEFGVGSSKFELEAINEKIAIFTMIMFFKSDILPIAIYKPQRKAIIGAVYLKDFNTENFIQENLIELKKTRESIKKLNLESSNNN